MESVRIGGLYDGDTKHQAGSVWDKNKLAPTIDTMQGGYREPMIIDEVKELGFMDNETQQIKVLTENVIIGGEQKHQAIKKDGVCTTLTSSMGTGGGYVPMVVSEQSIVAMRGRNPENPSDRTVGAPTEQRLEPNSQGICNTLTSVTKDNLVMETVRIKQATKDGYIECKVGGVADLSFPDSTTRRGRVQDGGDVCPTLMAGEQDICRIEKKCISTKGKENDVASTILSGYERSNMTGFNADNGVLENVNTQYRIRKLTPRECYRLMAVPEKDIDKMLEVNSNTQCYKQAGNSIVVNCLIAIFSQMGIQGIPRWNEGLNEKYK